MELGRFGVWTSYRSIGEENAGDTAGLIGDLGYGTFWLGGSPRLPSLAALLVGGPEITVATEWTALAAALEL